MSEGRRLPIYWGNRNWHPYLAETLRQMRTDGIKNALAFVTSVFSSYSGCRQYLEDIERARAEAGEGAPEMEKLRSFYNHPLFIEAETDRVREALDVLPADGSSKARIIFTAHSVPLAMAQTSDYQKQLNESCRLVAENLGMALAVGLSKPQWSAWTAVARARYRRCPARPGAGSSRRDRPHRIYL